MDSRESKPNYDLEKIDFEWVASTNSLKELKKGLKALQDDKGGYVDLEKAIEDKIIELDPSSKKPANTLSPEEMQNLEKDLESWSEKIENKEKLLKDEDTKELLINEALSQKAKEAGNDYLRAKDYDQALESYSKAIELNPRNAQAYFNRALVLLKQFKYRKAAEDCDKALLIDPKYNKVHHRRAVALMELKEYDKALEDWKKVLETDPENEEANEKLKKCRDELASITGYRRIQITEVDDDEEEDEGEAEEIKGQTDPTEPNQPANSEELLNIDQSPDLASEILKDPALQSIIALQSQDEFLKELDRLKTEGNACFRKEDYDQAIQLFTRSIYAIENRYSQEKVLVNPPVLTLTVAFYNNRALAYSKLDLNLEAINDSKKVLQLDSSNSKALFRIGKCQATRSNLQAAKEAFNQLLAAEPNNEVAKKELLEVEAKLSLLGVQGSVTSPKHRSSFRKHDPQEVDKSFERRVSFRDEDISLIEHKDSLKSKDKFKKAEAAFPKMIVSDDDEENQEVEEKEKQEVNEAKEERKVRPDKGISKETIQNAKDIASKLVVLEAPKTALMFESAAKSLKSDKTSFYEYIHKISSADLISLFDKSEFSAELLIQCIEASSVEDVDAEWAEAFYSAIPSTCRFSTTVKLLSKSEKSRLLNFFQSINSSSLASLYKLIN